MTSRAWTSIVINDVCNNKSMCFSKLQYDALMDWVMDVRTRGDHWAKIVEQRAIKNRVQYIHCR
jgi:hypothetical protein